MYPAFFKPLYDRLAALVALVILSPLLLGVMMISRVVLGSPVLFRQVRPGKDARLFTIFKLRTMSDARDSEGNLLPETQRLGRYGQWLRACSIDELPQLFNILRGDMSFVGPRPLLPEYLPHYSTEQYRRHEVRPGLTGLAQVSGRNAISWEEKFALDVAYVDRVSLWLDVVILCKTVMRVMRTQDIAHDGYTTMPRFDEHAPRSERVWMGCMS